MVSPKDLKRYQLEEFTKFLPNLEKILSEIEITDVVNEFEVMDLKFMARLNRGVMEFGLTIERPIFPTLAYEKQANGDVKLLYYRIDNYLPYKFKRIAQDLQDKC